VSDGLTLGYHALIAGGSVLVSGGVAWGVLKTLVKGLEKSNERIEANLTKLESKVERSHEELRNEINKCQTSIAVLATDAPANVRAMVRR
jgi:prefoldin subunit 5